MDIAASPDADEVWIPDNGPDQDVEAYSYSGSQVKRIGQSYLSGPTPGQIGPERFAGPRGVDVDGSGNVYVTETCNPGRQTKGWADDGYCMILSKHKPDGTQVWRVEDDDFADVGEPAPGEHRLYTPALIFNLSGDHWSLAAVTVDPWRYPRDPRWRDNALGFSTTATAQVRDVTGTRLMVTSQNGSNPRVFRISGDIAVPGAVIPNPGNSQDVAIAPNGDVYQLRGDQGVTRYPLTSLNPVAYGAGQNLPLPPGFVDARRLEIDGTRVFIAGFGSGESSANSATNYPLGKRIALFDALPGSSWPTPVWSEPIHWGTEPDVPTGMAADGARFAIAYASDGSGGYVRVYSTSNGSELGQIHWPSDIGSGRYDMARPLAFVDNVIYAEEDLVGKINMADLGPSIGNSANAATSEPDGE
jgi:hypothetical protein